VVELDAVRAFEVRRGLRRLLKQLEPHMLLREVGVAAVLDDIVARGDHLAFEDGFHERAPIAHSRRWCNGCPWAGPRRSLRSRARSARRVSRRSTTPCPLCPLLRP